MNQKIVKNSVRNFIENIQLNSSIISEACEELLWRSIRETRSEDISIYNEMIDRSTIAQTELLEQRLEMEFNPPDVVIETVGNAVLQAFKKSLDVNEFLGEEYSEEFVQTVLEDSINFLVIDEGFANSIKKWGKEKSLELSKWISKVVVSVMPVIAGVGGAAISSAFGNMFLINCIVFLVVLVSSAVGLSKLGVNIQKQMLDLFKGFIDVMGSLAKYVKDGSEKYKNFYDVIYKNEEKCYRKAGLDPNKLGIRHLLSVKDSWVSRFVLGVTEHEKIDILRNCFLESFLDRISIFFNLYFDCLRKTGNWSEIRNMSDDKFISMFRIKGGLYPACDQFRNSAVKAIKMYEDIIDHIYEEEPAKKSRWMLLLNRYILDIRNSQESIKREFKNQNRRTTFTGKKYQQLGRDLENEDKNYNTDWKPDRKK